MASSSDRPERIGSYTVVDVLGEGGMGVVYLAEQSEPVRRTVALKILKAGLGSEQVVTRFQTEFQALAVMDHPSIAKVFDAGVTDDGRPYFVMERVTGSPISQYCDDHRLSVRERIRLFTDVCRAVQHAHQKGVIHRDLKPSNVLVSDVDGRPHPRIIDFGIAKAVAWASVDEARLTREDQVVGTPAYMSPEQIYGSGDIDTRSDIYSLGVLLYELMVGSLPFDDDSYRGWGAVASLMLRDPPTPRQRLDSMVDTRETVASLRSTTPPVLRKELGGDLDWIVTRAMERDRSRRYETAVGLAMELERYLAFEPVRARGAGAAYRLRRFVRRNRVGVGFGSTVAAGLVAFAITMSIQADRIALARDEAEVRRDQAEGLIDFMLNDLREKLEPIGRLDVLGDVGDQAEAYFRSLPQSEFTEEELLSRSQALYQVGSVRLDEGNSGEAETAFRESLRLSKALVARDPRNVEWLFGLSQSHYWVGYAAWLHDDLESTEEEFQGYLDAAKTLVELKPDNLDYRLELGFAHSNLGSVREARGDLEAAVESYSRTLTVEQELVRRDSSNLDWLLELAETHNKLGVVYRRLGAYDQALEQHTREYDLKTELLGHDPTHAYWRLRLAMSLTFMSSLQWETGDLEPALRNQRQTVQILDSLTAYDPSNARWRRDAAMARLDLGEILARSGSAPASLTLLEESRILLEDLVRTDSTGYGWRGDLGKVDTQLAWALLETGRWREALEFAETARVVLALEPTTGRETAKRRAENELVLGRALTAAGRAAEAQEGWARALEIVDQLVSGPGGAEFHPLQVEVLLTLDRTAEARQLLLELWERGYADPYLSHLGSARGILP